MESIIRTKFKNKSLRPSQRIWLDRQSRDVYVKQAQKEGYRSRSAFKLIEINDKFKILKPSMKVVDLGSSPGGWSQILASKINKKLSGRVIALDIKNMHPITGVEFYKLDILKINSTNISDIIKCKVDAVFSDMSPSSTGHSLTDQLRSEKLCLSALDFSRLILEKGGDFCFKFLRGIGEKEILKLTAKYFNLVKVYKPDSSRKASKEIFIICRCYKNL